MVYVQEARVCHPSLQERTRASLTPVDAGRFENIIDPLHQVMFRLEGTVVGVKVQVEILKLDPASRLQMTENEGKASAEGKHHMIGIEANVLETVFHQCRPVSDGGGKISSKDKVKRRCVDPFAFDIVYLEPHVWRDPG